MKLRDLASRSIYFGQSLATASRFYENAGVLFARLWIGDWHGGRSAIFIYFSSQQRGVPRHTEFRDAGEFRNAGRTATGIGAKG